MENTPDSFSQRRARDAMSARNILLEDPDHEFKTRYNRSTFMFRHGLKGHPLLDLSSIIELGERLEKRGAVYWSNGPVDVSDRWDTGTSNRRPLTATLENIAANNSLVMLRSVVHDPVLGGVMREILTKIVDLVGPALRDDLICGRATILVASPRRITAYHIDSDVNFLMQVAGSKAFSVYNHQDETLITKEELERYFAGDPNGAVYKEERRQDATMHQLDAGYGAHVPSTAPHWAQNGDDVSIAVSFNYDLHSMERVGQIHRINRRLRRFGLRPAAPGTNGAIDTTKLVAYRAYAAGTRLVSAAPRNPDAFGWTPPSA
jgi:hypothetical protein